MPFTEAIRDDRRNFGLRALSNPLINAIGLRNAVINYYCRDRFSSYELMFLISGLEMRLK